MSELRTPKGKEQNLGLEEKKTEQASSPICPRYYKLVDIDEISLTGSIARDIGAERIENIVSGSSEQEDKERIQKINETLFKEDLFADYSEFYFNIESSEEDEISSERLSIEDLFEKKLIKTKTEIKFHARDIKLYPSFEAQYRLKDETFEFLHAIIDAVVGISEYANPNEKIHEDYHLDKVKLFRELIRLLNEFYSENKVAEYLSKKCVHCYRRSKDLRSLTLEKEEILPMQKQQYKEILDGLNCLLGKEKVLKAVNTKRLSEAEETAMKLEQNVECANSKLESLMRTTLGTICNSKFMQMMLDRKIREMTDLRKEICAVREVFINRQQAYEQLLEKIANLEHITSTLQLHDYEHMLIEEFRLSKKLEEKSLRLLSIQQRFHAHTNAVAHIREKQSMYFHITLKQSKILNEADLEKQKLQDYVHKLRLGRMQMKKEIDDKNFDLGLIGQPDLLMAFYETVKRGREKKSNIEALKDEIFRLEHKIKFFKKRSAFN